MNDKFSYFTPENKCYESKFDSGELEKYINDNFYTENMNIKSSSKSIVDECEKKAISNNKEFFLVTDFTNNSNGSTFNCLIPKVDKMCDISNIADLLQPFNNAIKNLFKTNKSILFSDTLNIKQNIKIEDINKTKQIDNCFKINNKHNDLFAKNGYFILYKTELIKNEEYINSLKNIQSYLEYKKKYENNFINNVTFNNIKTNFVNFICLPNTNNENKLDTEIMNLKNMYAVMFNDLDYISRDISTMSVLTKYETLYLKEIQKNIDKLKKDINSLIGFDGANNGKLLDTRFLKNLTLSESIILILLISFMIFLYRNKKI